MENYDNLTNEEKLNLLFKKQEQLKLYSKPNKAEKMERKFKNIVINSVSAAVLLVSPFFLTKQFAKEDLIPFYRDTLEKPYYQHYIQDSKGSITILEGYNKADILEDENNYKETISISSVWKQNKDGSYSKKIKTYQIDLNKDLLDKIIKNINSGNIDKMLGEPISVDTEKRMSLTEEELNSGIFWEADYLDTDPSKTGFEKESGSRNFWGTAGYIILTIFGLIIDLLPAYWVNEDLEDLKKYIGIFEKLRINKKNDLNSEINRLKGSLDNETYMKVVNGLIKLEEYQEVKEQKKHL